MGVTLGRSRRTSPAAGPAPKTSRTRAAELRSTLARAVAGGAGLLLVGGALGHQLWPPNVTTIEEVVPTPAPSASVGQTSAPSMPDVAGLSEAVARRALTDAGVTDAVTVTTKPAAGPAGLVVTQAPTPGQPAGPVTLALSVAASVPDLNGRPLADARNTLQALGAGVVTSRVVAPRVAVGTVTGSTPAAGAPLPLTVELAVADPGVALRLDELVAAQESGCSSTSTPVTVGGAVQQSSLRCLVARTDVTFGEYVLGKHAQVFTATLGLDDARALGTADVTAFGDDRSKPLATWHLTHGQPVAVSLPVDGVLRLRLQVAPQNIDKTPTVVFGSAAVLGDPDELAQAKRP